MLQFRGAERDLVHGSGDATIYSGYVVQLRLDIDGETC